MGRRERMGGFSRLGRLGCVWLVSFGRLGWKVWFGLACFGLVWFGSLGPGFKGLIVRAVFYRWVGL